MLVTQGLSPSLRATEDGVVVLSVPAEQREEALAALSAYEIENPVPVPEEGHDTQEPPSLLPGIVTAAVLLASHAIVVRSPASTLWLERGSADAGRILSGETWRAVTALTLHADLAHVLSNAAGAAVFVAALSSMLGSGLAFALFLLAGAGGNLLNAYFYGPPHMSIGASTAVFGAVGMLGGLAMAKRRKAVQRGRRRAWIPIAAALGLLAILGTGGGRVDVLAHLFGFSFGAVLGVFVAYLAPDPPRLRAQWSWGAVALAVVIWCWTLAFSG